MNCTLMFHQLHASKKYIPSPLQYAVGRAKPITFYLTLFLFSPNEHIVFELFLTVTAGQFCSGPRPSSHRVRPVRPIFAPFAIWGPSGSLGSRPDEGIHPSSDFVNELKFAKYPGKLGKIWENDDGLQCAQGFDTLSPSLPSNVSSWGIPEVNGG